MSAGSKRRRDGERKVKEQRRERRADARQMQQFAAASDPAVFALAAVWSRLAGRKR